MRARSRKHCSYLSGSEAVDHLRAPITHLEHPLTPLRSWLIPPIDHFPKLLLQGHKCFVNAAQIVFLSQQIYEVGALPDSPGVSGQPVRPIRYSLHGVVTCRFAPETVIRVGKSLFVVGVGVAQVLALSCHTLTKASAALRADCGNGSGHPRCSRIRHALLTWSSLRTYRSARSQSSQDGRVSAAPCCSPMAVACHICSRQKIATSI